MRRGSAPDCGRFSWRNTAPCRCVLGADHGEAGADGNGAHLWKGIALRVRAQTLESDHRLVVVASLHHHQKLFAAKAVKLVAEAKTATDQARPAGRAVRPAVAWQSQVAASCAAKVRDMTGVHG